MQHHVAFQAAKVPKRRNFSGLKGHLKSPCLLKKNTFLSFRIPSICLRYSPNAGVSWWFTIKGKNIRTYSGPYINKHKIHIPLISIRGWQFSGCLYCVGDPIPASSAWQSGSLFHGRAVQICTGSESGLGYVLSTKGLSPHWVVEQKMCQVSRLLKTDP